MYQSLKNLETQAKQQLEEVYSEEDCETRFESNRCDEGTSQDSSYIQQNGTIISGWESPIKPKRDKLMSDSAINLARSTLCSLGDNIQRYHNNPSEEKISSLYRINQNSVSQRNSSSQHSRIISKTINCMAKEISSSFGDEQHQQSSQISNSGFIPSQRRSSVQNSQKIQNAVNNSAAFRKFHLDYSSYRMHLRSAGTIENESNNSINQQTEAELEIGISDRECNQFQEQPQYRFPAACFMIRDQFQSEYNTSKRHARANSANPSLSKLVQADMNSKQSNFQKQRKLLQAKMFPNSFAISIQDISNKDSKQEKETESPPIHFSKKRMIFFRNSFKSAIDHLNQRTATAGDANNNKTYSNSQPIHNLKILSNRIPTKGEQEQDKLNISEDTCKQAQFSDRKRTKNILSSSVQLDNLSSTTKKDHLIIPQYQTLVVESSNLSFDQKQNNFKSPIQTRLEPNKMISSSCNVSTKNMKKQIINSTIVNLEDNRAQTANGSSPSVNYETAHKQFKKYSTPITLRQQILHKRFESVKKSTIMSANNEKQSELIASPDEQQNKSIISSLLKSSKPFNNQINLFNTYVSEKNTRKNEGSKLNMDLLSNKSNRFVSTPPLKQHTISSKYQPFSRVTGSDSQEGQFVNAGCIQNNFLYQKILQNQ